MKHTISKIVLIVTAIALLSLGAWVVTTKAAGASYYVDCSAATNGSGTQASPWNTLTTVNATTFQPGDTVYFKRGATCNGRLWPRGSGNSTSVITLDAYGTGALPIINGGTNESAFKMGDAATSVVQEYWDIQNLEFVGGTRYGMWFNMPDNPGAHNQHYHLTNLVVHGVHGGNMDVKYTGLIVFGDYNWNANDILIDNVTAYDTTMWAGITITGGYNNINNRTTNVVIRNSTVHDTYGDGILVTSTNGVLIETSVAYETGNQPTQTIGTPNAIWTWDTDNGIVQNTEAYLNDSPGVDGGAYDIDYFNTNNTVQYNYAHDNAAYCVSVFGAERWITTNSIVRYNICSNNARVLDQAVQGDIYFSTWTNGKLDGVQIYNNTIYWNPVADYPALYVKSGTAFTGTRPNFFKNNIIYSTVPSLVSVVGNVLKLDYNLYWNTNGSGKWVYNGATYTTFSAYKTGSAQDAHGLYVNPQLNDPTYHAVGKPVTSFTLQGTSPAINAGVDVCIGISGCSMGAHDFFGNSIPSSGAYDIGANEYGGVPGATPTPTPIPTAGPSPTPTNTLVPTATTSNVNIALNRPVTVSSTNGTGFEGTKAVDGNMTTYWRSLKRSSLPSQWINVDLGSSTTISRVELEWWSSGTVYGHATAYTIQVSQDNTNWTTVATVTGGDGGNDTINFTPVAARYVKMDSTAWSKATEGCYLYEYEMGVFHLSYKVIRQPKVTGSAWSGYLGQMLGEQAEN